MSVQNFITNFNGGTRKNRFRVSCNIPGFDIPDIPGIDITDEDPSAINTASEGDKNVLGGFDDFHVLAAAMPASILTTNPIDFRGRKILYPGDRIYSADGFNVWTVTIQDDITGSLSADSGSYFNNNLWSRLHLWCNGINSHGINIGNTTSDSESDIVVRQLNLNGTKIIKQCTLKNAWPQSVGPIDMEMQARDQYNSFEVTFCFKYVVYEDLDQ
jgi:hypothetical protein